ncbi:transposase [Haloferula luteola]|uniref:Transposase n=1 Tax=Haloferula luteola TaxID=595692 RepID=A0A840V5V9_9BACT|nr:helix-turn-helix domain-containing protein [Haloferula luteola]MBB5352416.1 transposase [Haloferula luteola]
MATLSIDLRERILKAYDRGDVTRDQVAQRFEVSLGMVKKLLQQRRHTGDIAPQHHRSGRKPKIEASHRRMMKALLVENPDLTLEEIRAAAGLECSVLAIHYTLSGMGLTYKKRRSALPNRTARMSLETAAGGKERRAVSNPGGSSSSTNRRQKRT